MAYIKKRRGNRNFKRDSDNRPMAPFVRIFCRIKQGGYPPRSVYVKISAEYHR